MSLALGSNSSGSGIPDFSLADEENVRGDSKLTATWNFAKAYALHLGVVALEIAIPLIMLVAVSGASDVRDPERFGLSWLHWTRLGNDLERETMYPSHEQSSKAQKNRMEAARAVEGLTVTDE